VSSSGSYASLAGQGASLKIRERILARFERTIEKRGYPRTILVFLLGLSGLASLIASIAFLRLGMTHMGVRYFCCVAIGYLTFLGLLRLWASREAGLFDLADLNPTGSTGSGLGPSGFESVEGGGGGFSGGGASSSWDSDALTSDAVDMPERLGSSSSVDVSGGLDLDEGWILALPLALLVGIGFAAGYVVSIAPILFAEVVLDVAIAAGAYRRIAKLDPQHWMIGPLRKTW
jgi:hypothetical protein